MGGRRIDARATMSKSKSCEWYAEAAVDTVARRMTVNDAAGFELRIADGLPHGTDTCGGHMVRLQEFLPFSRGARAHDFAKHRRFALAVGFAFLVGFFDHVGTFEQRP